MKPAKAIEDAQRILHKEVQASLEKFTEATGLCVPSMYWHVERALGCDGNAIASAYFDLRSAIQTGIS